jgi:hypothetical protein
MYSDAQQDEFAIRINNGKNNGFYLDIGSCGAYSSNNTALFEAYSWNGICVELDKNYASSYSTRSCTLIIADALKLNYSSIFNQCNAPNSIDYLSLDVDQASVDVLKILPHDLYRFKVITIEHDAYLYGDKYRGEQRKILSELGYHLLCSNVYVQQPGFERKECAFEDWWIDPVHVDLTKFLKIQCDGKYPIDIINSF